MEHRRFGPTKREVAAIGQGTWYGDGEAPASALAALRKGLDWGMTHIDTAEMYEIGACCADPGVFAIPKAATLKHAEENAGAGGFQLSLADMDRIDDAFPPGPRPSTLPML